MLEIMKHSRSNLKCLTGEKNDISKSVLCFGRNLVLKFDDGIVYCSYCKEQSPMGKDYHESCRTAVENYKAPPVRQRILLTNYDVFNDLMFQDAGFSDTHAKHLVTTFNNFIFTHPYSRFVQFQLPTERQFPIPVLLDDLPVPERVEFAIVRGDSQVLKNRMRDYEIAHPGLSPREYIDHCYELLRELFAMEF